MLLQSAFFKNRLNTKISPHFLFLYILFLFVLRVVHLLPLFLLRINSYEAINERLADYN
jgi:hypothetical protein